MRRISNPCFYIANLWLKSASSVLNLLSASVLILSCSHSNLWVFAHSSASSLARCSCSCSKLTRRRSWSSRSWSNFAWVSARMAAISFYDLKGLSSVILATTMWSGLSESPSISEQREEKLKSPQFWGSMVGQGSSIIRYKGTKQLAMKIVSRLVERGTNAVLDI